MTKLTSMALIALLTVLAVPAMADVDCDKLPGHIACQGGGDGGGNGGGAGGPVTVTNDIVNRNVNENTNWQAQGQQQGQIQGQIATGGTATTGDQTTRVTTGDVTNRLSNDSTSVSGSVSTSSSGDSSAYNGGNTLIIGGGYGEQEGEGGGSTLSPTATSTATNGDQSNTQTVGDTNVTVVNEGLTDSQARALGQPDVVTVEGDRNVETDNIDASTTINDNSVYKAPKMSAATAAPVFSTVCTSGASGQGRAFGFGLAVTSSVCEHLMMADAFNAVGNEEMVEKHLTWASKKARFRGSMSNFRTLITFGIL